jgi:glycosyltransferase involved in cell wall biosynthesis
MLNEEPTLSIVVPSFNQGEFLNDNIGELVKYRGDIEIIVMDGGSTDNTVQYLTDMTGSIDCWVSEKDRGQAHAINKGILRARAAWVGFQNSDDYYVAGALRSVLKEIREADGVDVIIGGTVFVDEQGRTIKSSLPKPIFYSALSVKNLVNNQSFFVARKFVERVGMLREDLDFCLDYEWFLRIFKEKPRVKYIYEVTGAQRFHENTKTQRMQTVHDREFEACRLKFFSPAQRVFGKIMFPGYRAFRLVFGFAAKMM